jgi:hypothetical protein
MATPSHPPSIPSEPRTAASPKAEVPPSVAASASPPDQNDRDRRTEAAQALLEHRRKLEAQGKLAKRTDAELEKIRAEWRR